MLAPSQLEKIQRLLVIQGAMEFGAAIALLTVSSTANGLVSMLFFADILGFTLTSPRKAENTHYHNDLADLVERVAIYNVLASVFSTIECVVLASSGYWLAALMFWIAIPLRVFSHLKLRQMDAVEAIREMNHAVLVDQTSNQGEPVSESFTAIHYVDPNPQGGKPIVANGEVVQGTTTTTTTAITAVAVNAGDSVPSYAQNPYTDEAIPVYAEPVRGSDDVEKEMNHL
eukprot:TRINITY_DN644_c0_g1_i4.p2 TRINITY_DN644_c0_g1~~TRINITY_DN644_c0_g1_i4.p2  ORF type:complete len:229 (-),score=60.51 TRINITY_DN644_c0_g1_i4:1129-1815(-)